MLRKVENMQSEYEFIAIEELVTQNHLLRVIDENFDFSFISDILGPFYCKNNARSAVELIRIVKLHLIGYLFGIRSERQLCAEVQINVAYRWFLGYSLKDRVPHHSTISKLRTEKFKNTIVFQDIFFVFIAHNATHLIIIIG